jgi:hypothetical protein
MIDAAATCSNSKSHCDMFPGSLCIPYLPAEHTTGQDQQTNKSNHRAHNNQDKRVGDRKFQTVGSALETQEIKEARKKERKKDQGNIDQGKATSELQCVIQKKSATKKDRETREVE